jgi:serine/threonine-protein kinase HipA
MTPTCTLQLHARRTWHDVASVSLHGPEPAGWKARTYSGYAVESDSQTMGLAEELAALA